MMRCPGTLRMLLAIIVVLLLGGGMLLCEVSRIKWMRKVRSSAVTGLRPSKGVGIMIAVLCLWARVMAWRRGC